MGNDVWHGVLHSTYEIQHKLTTRASNAAQAKTALDPRAGHFNQLTRHAYELALTESGPYSVCRPLVPWDSTDHNGECGSCSGDVLTSRKQRQVLQPLRVKSVVSSAQYCIVCNHGAGHSLLAAQRTKPEG